jgi:hypothetical protein
MHGIITTQTFHTLLVWFTYKETDGRKPCTARL